MSFYDVGKMTLYKGKDRPEISESERVRLIAEKIEPVHIEGHETLVHLLQTGVGLTKNVDKDEYK